MKIILATDFNDANDTLIKYAFDMLKGKDGSLLLFHAYAKPEDFKDAEDKMSSTINMLCDFGHINVSYVLKQGDAEEGLLELIQAEQADMVLMCTRGRGKKVFLEGSLSRRLMSSSPIPLLSIHEDHIYKESSEVLFVTNFNKRDFTSIQQIFGLLEPYHPHLHVVHCILDGDPVRASQLLSKLESTMEHMDFSGHVCYKLLYSTNPRQALKAYCEENDISLVAFTPRKKTFGDLFFKDRVTKNDFYDLHLPLLTFRK